MKKRVILILVSCFLLVLDNCLSPFISIRGCYPSFLYVFAIAYSIINGKKEGVIIGVVSGLLQDMFFYSGFGINALINMIICYIAGGIGEGIWREKKLVPVIAMFLASILKFVSIFIIFYTMNIYINLSKSLITGLYNSMLMILTYKTILKTFNRDDMRKAWRF
ncbi:MAG: rod shape-determining protein MreD [Clostridium sp.]|nr:rod shape-determining protein MreD [Clostridium sp.]